MRWLFSFSPSPSHLNFIYFERSIWVSIRQQMKTFLFESKTQFDVNARAHFHGVQTSEPSGSGSGILNGFSTPFHFIINSMIFPSHSFFVLSSSVNIDQNVLIFLVHFVKNSVGYILLVRPVLNWNKMSERNHKVAHFMRVENIKSKI